MTILNMLGLMTKTKHRELSDIAVARLESALVSKDETIERVCGERDRLSDRLSAAVRDLAKQADEIASLKTDAEKLRSKRANDAALKREKRAAAKAQPLAA